MLTQHPLNRDRKDARNTPTNTRRDASQHAYALVLQYFNHIWVHHLTNPKFWSIFTAALLPIALQPFLENSTLPQSDLIAHVLRTSFIAINLCMIGYSLLLGTALAILFAYIAGHAILLGVIALSIGLAHSFAALLEAFERDYTNVHRRLSSTYQPVIFVLRLLLWCLAFLVIFVGIFGIVFGALDWNGGKIQRPDGGYHSLPFHIGCGIALFVKFWARIATSIVKKAIEGIVYLSQEIVEGSQKAWKLAL